MSCNAFWEILKVNLDALIFNQMEYNEWKRWIFKKFRNNRTHMHDLPRVCWTVHLWFGQLAHQQTTMDPYSECDKNKQSRLESREEKKESDISITLLLVLYMGVAYLCVFVILLVWFPKDVRIFIVLFIIFITHHGGLLGKRRRKPPQKYKKC